MIPGNAMERLDSREASATDNSRRLSLFDRMIDWGNFGSDVHGMHLEVGRVAFQNEDRRAVEVLRK